MQRSSSNGEGSSRFNRSERFFVRAVARRPSAIIYQHWCVDSSRFGPPAICRWNAWEWRCAQPPDSSDSKGVAVLSAGAKQFAPPGPHQRWLPSWELAGSKGWRIDPRAQFGRPARGERMAKPPPASIKHRNQL